MAFRSTGPTTEGEQEHAESTAMPVTYGALENYDDSWVDYFLLSLSECGNVTQAAKDAGIARLTAYRHRDRDPRFADAWDDAIEEAVDRLEAEARRRAIEGVDEPVFYKGKPVGRVKKYSDTLMIFLLKAHRPEKFRDNFDLAKIAMQLGMAAQQNAALPQPSVEPPADLPPTDGPDPVDG